MADSFRFLINVDQCLNMSSYDMFFYQLESQHRFHASEVQLFGEQFGSSLQHAVMDIRSYLNKYSYYVDDYQVIVAMRSEFHEQYTEWKETLLYRLLQLDYELQKAQIFVIAHETTERAVNLIMLYDADFNVNLPHLKNYISGKRFMDDCKLLFCEAGLNWDAWETAEEQRRKVEIYAGKPDHDEAVLLLLRAFLDGGTGREKENEQSMFDADDAGGDGSDKEEQVQFSSFVKTRLVNYHVFETLVNRNRERDKILSMLRLVEFINRSTEPKAVVTGEENHSSLATRCEENWNDILSDQQIEQRYANMLANYKATLIHARQDLERGGFSRNTAQKLPEKHIPADDEIRPESKVLDPEGREKKELVLREKMEAFEKLSWHAGDEDWEQTYTELKESFSRMEKDLKDYARGLSIQYASALERRKKETLPWERESYEPGPDIETVSQGVAYDRETRLKKLKDSHIHSSLSFQDQLNVENALEQCNASIRFKMYCAKALSAANFFALFLLILALFLGHYVVLQPYVFLDEQLLLYALIYIAAAAVLLLSAWKLPALFFHRRIKRDLDRLRDSIELYIRGYFEKADYFLSYINLLNQLDYISRYGSMVTRVRTESEYLEKGVKWHLVQVGLHLDRLSFFSGLIELKSKTDGQDVLRRIEPTDYNGNIQDVVRCQVYWPQG